MPRELSYTTYAISPRTRLAVGFTAAAGAGSVIFGVASDDTFAVATRFWIIVTTLGLVAFLLLLTARAATITTPDHLAIRWLRTRRIPWADVQDIRIEINPAAVVKGNARRAPSAPATA